MCLPSHPPQALLRPWGIVLRPAVGAILMSASTVICAINARMLRLK
jgi:P-type Cu2+ transporter